MRRIVARTSRQQGYSDPITAIHRGVEIDLQKRSVSDREVKGKQIHRLLWSDSALVLELEDNCFLNCIATHERITCALESNLALIPNETDGTILLELERHTFEWHRAEIASRYVGKTISRLWFSDRSVLIYVLKMPILACHPLEIWPDRIPMIFWTESE